MTTLGLLLAAGAGRRMGKPKALVADERGAWLPRAVQALDRGGCDRVVVVLGAEAERARTLLEGGLEQARLTNKVTIVVAEDWAQGMGSSLVAGLRHACHGEDTRCLVSLVDLPDLGPDVVRRLLALPDTVDVLARATYDARPGHPVLLGRDHWPGVLDSSLGDTGARNYLADREVTGVECGDLATGDDVDRPPAPASQPTSHQPASE